MSFLDRVTRTDVDAVLGAWRAEQAALQGTERAARREATIKPIYVSNPELDEYVRKAREETAV